MTSGPMHPVWRQRARPRVNATCCTHEPRSSNDSVADGPSTPVSDSIVVMPCGLRHVRMAAPYCLLSREIAVRNVDRSSRGADGCPTTDVGTPSPAQRGRSTRRVRLSRGVTSYWWVTDG